MKKLKGFIKSMAPALAAVVVGLWVTGLFPNPLAYVKSKLKMN